MRFFNRNLFISEAAYVLFGAGFAAAYTTSH